MQAISRQDADIFASALEKAAQRSLDDAIQVLPQMVKDSAGVIRITKEIGNQSDSRHLKAVAREIGESLTVGYGRLDRLRNLLGKMPLLDDLALGRTGAPEQEQVDRMRRVVSHLASSKIAWDWAALQYSAYIRRFDFIQKTYLRQLPKQRAQEAVGVVGTLVTDVAMAWFPFRDTVEATLKVQRDKVDRLGEDLRVANQPLERAELLLRAMEGLEDLGQLTEDAILAALAVDAGFGAI